MARRGSCPPRRAHPGSLGERRPQPTLLAPGLCVLGFGGTKKPCPFNPGVLTQDTLLLLSHPKVSPNGPSPLQRVLWEDWRCPGPGDPWRWAGPRCLVPGAWVAPSSQGSSRLLKASSSGPEVGLPEALPPYPLTHQEDFLITRGRERRAPTTASEHCLRCPASEGGLEAGRSGGR